MGRVILVRPEQKINAPYPIDAHRLLSSNVILVRPEQLLNAFIPIDVTLLVIITPVILGLLFIVGIKSVVIKASLFKVNVIL